MHRIITLGLRLSMVIAFVFANQMIYAQQKFTIQLATGGYKQFPIEGLKITFDNKGSFSCWQNGLKQDIYFDYVGLFCFTDQVLSVRSVISDSFKVYPNPTTGMITIEFNQNSGENCKVSVSNLTGAVVFRKELTDVDNYQIDLTNQISGFYVLRIVINNQSYVHKLVIRKY